jgi:hypothetical protein
MMQLKRREVEALVASLRGQYEGRLSFKSPLKRLENNDPDGIKAWLYLGLDNDSATGYMRDLFTAVFTDREYTHCTEPDETGTDLQWAQDVATGLAKLGIKTVVTYEYVKGNMYAEVRLA